MNKSFAYGFIAAAALALVVFLAPHLASSINLSAAVTPAVTSSTSNTTTAGIACIRTAVAAREAAIDKANTTFEQVSNVAYAARASALNTAYSQTSWTTVTQSANAAFTTFATAESNAQLNLEAADELAANTYNAAVVTCQAKYPSVPQAKATTATAKPTAAATNKL